jgi:Fe-S-cluster-containing hydrogenase component 2
MGAGARQEGSAELNVGRPAPAQSEPLGQASAASAARNAGLLPLLLSHRAGCGPKPGEPARPRSTMGRWRALVLILVHVAIAARIVHWKLTGSAMTPLEPSEAGLALTDGLFTAGFFFFLLLLLSTAVFGRFFCGWGCHLVALQDACSALLKRLGLAPRPLRSRLLVWVPWIGALELFLLPGLLRLLDGGAWPTVRMHLVTDDFWARFPGPGVALFTFAVCGGLIVWALGNKGFCTYACPYGALFGALERVAPGKIRVTSACEGCGHCTAVCSSNVRVHEEVRAFGQVVDSGCMKCLDCVSACPKDALYFGFRADPEVAAAQPPTQRSKRSTRRYDFTWGEELALLLLFLVGLYALRNLYGLVPFLLALALGSLFALMGLLLWRLWRQSELRFQRLLLKQAGRLTKSGFAALLPLCAGVLLVGHSAHLQWQAREGQRLLFEAGLLSDSERAARVQAAFTRLRAVEAQQLLPIPDLAHQLGALELELGDLPAALRHLEAAQAAAPRSLAVLDKLATAQRALGDELGLQLSLARALALLSARDPEHARGQAQLAAADAIAGVAAHPEDERPLLLLCWIQALLGDKATASANAAKRKGSTLADDWRTLERFTRAAN